MKGVALTKLLTSLLELILSGVAAILSFCLEYLSARSRGVNTLPFHALLKCTPEMYGKPT